MGDLVAHHHRHRVLGLRHRDQAGVNGHLAPRQAEGVGLLGGNDVDVPFERLPVVRCRQPVAGGHLGGDFGHLGDQAPGDLLDLLRSLVGSGQRPLLRQDLLVGLQAHRPLLLRSDRGIDQHRLAGIGVHAAVGQVIAAAIGHEAEQDQPAQAADVETAPARRLPVLLVPALLPEGILSHCPVPLLVQMPRTRRKPMRALVMSESIDARQAERVCTGEPDHTPPRITRWRQPGLNHAVPPAGARR